MKWQSERNLFSNGLSLQSELKIGTPEAYEGLTRHYKNLF